jgi:polysaccharide biosynthesis protein PslE
MNGDITKRTAYQQIPQLKFSMRDLYAAICKHRIKAICTFLTVFSGVAAFSVLMPKTYQSQSLLYVRLGRENVRLDATTTLGQPSQIAIPASRESEIKSIVGILKSRALAEKVVDAVGASVILGEASGNGLSHQVLGEDPQYEAASSPTLAEGADGLTSPLGYIDSPDYRERAISKLSKKFSAHGLDKSDLLSLTYRARTPALAQQVVHAYVEIYLKQHAQLNHPPHAMQFLDQQTARLKSELADSEAQLELLKQETNLASPKTQRELLVTRLSRLQDELLTTEAMEGAIKSEIDVLDRSLAALSVRRVDTVTTGLSNTATDGMRQTLYALQLQEKRLSALYKASHPNLSSIRDQIAQSEAVLNHETEQRQTTTESPNRVFEELNLTRVRQESLLSSMTAKAALLRKQIDDAKQQFDVHIANELRVDKLEREVQLQDAGYRKYFENLEQARIDQALESERISNINIIQPASFSEEPVGLNILVTLVAGFLMSAAAAFGVVIVANVLDHSLKSPEDVEDSLGLPLLVSIPRLNNMQLHLPARVEL